MGVKSDISELLAESENEDPETLEFNDLEKEEIDTPSSDFKEEGEAEEVVEEKEVEKEEEIDEEKKKPVESTGTKEGRKLSKEIEQILAQLNKDETLKSKGLEIKVGDFTPDELHRLLQKGIRFYQAMEEVSTSDRKVKERELALAQRTQRVQEFEAKVSQQLKSGAFRKEITLPKELEIAPDDDPNTIAIKTAAKAQWESNRQLSDRLDSIEGGFTQRQAEDQERALVGEIEGLRSDFPLASPEETIAVYTLSKGTVPIRQIMQMGQGFYGSTKFVDRVFEHCPDVRKYYYEKFSKEYAAKLNKVGAKRVPIRPSGSSSNVVSSTKKKGPITFENIGSHIRKFVAEKERIESEEEA